MNSHILILFSSLLSIGLVLSMGSSVYANEFKSPSNRDSGVAVSNKSEIDLKSRNRFEATKQLLKSRNKSGSEDIGLVRASRRGYSPEEKWKRQVGLDTVPSSIDLRDEAKEGFRKQLGHTNHPLKRQLLYKEAYECGIPPDNLLVKASPSDRGLLDEFAITSLNQGDVDERLYKQLARIREIPDSEYKGEIFANSLLAASDSTKFSLIAQELKGIPSTRAISKLSDSDILLGSFSDSQQQKAIDILSKSLVEDSIEPLFDIVRSDTRITEVTGHACRGLSPWIQRKDVRSVLTQKLLQPDAEPIFGLVDSIRRTGNGLYETEYIFRNASNPIVRERALRALTLPNGEDPTVHHDLLWGLLSDESIPLEYRITLLIDLGDYYSQTSPMKKEQIEEWAQRGDDLGEAARRVLSGEESLGSKANRMRQDFERRQEARRREKAKIVGTPTSQNSKNNTKDVRQISVFIQSHFLKQADINAQWLTTYSYKGKKLEQNTPIASNKQKLEIKPIPALGGELLVQRKKDRVVETWAYVQYVKTNIVNLPLDADYLVKAGQQVSVALSMPKEKLNKIESIELYFSKDSNLSIYTIKPDTQGLWATDISLTHHTYYAYANMKNGKSVPLGPLSINKKTGPEYTFELPLAKL